MLITISFCVSVFLIEEYGLNLQVRCLNLSCLFAVVSLSAFLITKLTDPDAFMFSTNQL